MDSSWTSATAQVNLNDPTGCHIPPPSATANNNEVLYTHVQRTVGNFLRSHSDCLVCVTGDFSSTSTQISPSIFRQRCSLSPIIKVLTRDTGILDWFLTNNPKCWSPPCQLPKISTSHHFTVLIQPVMPAAKPAKRLVTFCDAQDSAIRSFGCWTTTFSWDRFYSIA